MSKRTGIGKECAERLASLGKRMELEEVIVDLERQLTDADALERQLKSTIARLEADRDALRSAARLVCKSLEHVEVMLDGSQRWHGPTYEAVQELAAALAETEADE